MDWVKIRILMMDFKYKKLGLWFGIIAILFSSLVPVISQAIDLDDKSNIEVVCSIGGIKLINVSNENTLPDNVQLNLNQCAYCSFGTHNSALTSNKSLVPEIDVIQPIDLTAQYNSPYTKVLFLFSHTSHSPPVA
jgi:hypothetical protein